MQSIWREVNGFQLIWGQFSIDSSSNNNVHSSRPISGLAQIRPIPLHWPSSYLAQTLCVDLANNRGQIHNGQQDGALKEDG
jgi:hypothetical protein